MGEMGEPGSDNYIRVSQHDFFLNGSCASEDINIFLCNFN